ncbi:MAG: Ig-like domain-containing protein [Polyangiaceae bacterium]
MRRAWMMVLVIAAAVFAAFPIACGENAGTTGSDGGSGGSGANGGEAGSGADFGFGGQMEVLEITPPSAEITVTDGVSTPVDFDLLLNGNAVSAKWAVDKGTVVSVDDNGTVTATGKEGGEVKVTAFYGKQSKSATVVVKIIATQNPGGVTDPEIAILKEASEPDGGVAWLYPYDKTVFPKGIYPPELMWNGGGGGDTYYVHYKTQWIDIGILTKADPPSRFLLDEETWRTITESGKGADVELKVARLTPGADKATIIVDHTWKIAPGALRGSVYYWANSLGRILRIDPGKGTAPEDFLAAAGVTDACSTCHTVSAKGNKLVIGGDTAASVYDLLTDTVELGIGSIGKPVRNWAMPALSPDGKVLIENNAPLPGPPGGSDGMWDPETGTKLLGTGLDGVLLDMPAFSPSGKLIAAVDHAAPHGLIKYSFDAGTNMVSGFTQLVEAGADANLNAICFPSVSPTGADMKTWATYHRGVYPSSLDTRYGPGWLFLASMDTPGLEIRLRNANGDDYPFAAGDRDRSNNYEPTFAPEEAGGYKWVVFTSRRTYGNRLTGNSTQVKQLWIAAVDANVTDGADPSHPAFWVPGQDANLNMRGFWALEPCKHQGDSCSDGSECCGGNCTDGMCYEQPEGCSLDGDTCTEDADCCNPSSKCDQGTCGEAPQ